MTKRFAVLLSFATLIVTMASTLSGAASFTVYGSKDHEKYKVGKHTTAVEVTSFDSPWQSGNWMTYKVQDQSVDSGSPKGDYLYVTEFDLGDLDPETAYIRGTWASDGKGELYLNPTTLNRKIYGYKKPVSQSPDSVNITYFEITGGFRKGRNVLTFLVHNETDGPTGLLVNVEVAEADHRSGSHRHHSDDHRHDDDYDDRHEDHRDSGNRHHH